MEIFDAQIFFWEALENYIEVKIVMEEVADLVREMLGEERQIS